MWQALHTRVMDGIYPRVCCSCGARIREGQESGLCWDCRLSAIPLTPPWCSICGQHLPGRVDHAFVCRACHEQKPGYDQARSLYRYEGGVRDAIHALKYQRDLSVVEDLARILTAGLMDYEAEAGWILVPIPLYWRKFGKRGFNQSELLARGVKRLPVQNLLRRVKDTETQTHLTAAQRRSNVRNAFSLRKRHRLPERVVLVDDVMTTGATLHAAALCLRKAGVERIEALTIARG